MDAESYFSILSEVLPKAQHQVMLIGWEFDTRTILRRDVVAKQNYRFSTLVRRAIRVNRNLGISILAWKYSKIYIFDREFFQRIHLGWPNIRRLRFRYDDNHPIAASHHEKIVVVDDRLAFCGGLDLSKGRWDTTAHTADDPRRITSAGDKYEPFHDVQAMVNGEVAAALGLLCRKR